MSTLKRFLDQQYGLQKCRFYDNFVERLRCTKDDQFSQILPYEDVVNDTPIFACKFAHEKHSEHYLALANEDGKLAIHDTRNNEERYGIRAHNNAIFDLAWMFDSMKIVTASGDHKAKLFDVSTPEIREIKSFDGHRGSVKTVAFRKDDCSVFATGGRDGNIIVWDTRTQSHNFVGKEDRKIYNSHSTKSNPNKTRKKSSVSSTKSVTGLVFQDDYTLISCGAGDGVIKFWDLRKNYYSYRDQPVAKNTICYGGSTTKNGFSSIILDKSCLRLYANCLDNNIYCYNIGTCNPVPLMCYEGHQNSTFYIKSALSKDGYYLISGSSDENAYIWDVNHTKPLAKLTGHSAEVTCVAWCDSAEITLVTCSDDKSHKIWRVGPEELPENWEITGKGHAERMSVRSPNSKKSKRYQDDLNQATKKLAMHCRRCDKVSSKELCSACKLSKRSHSQDNLRSAKRACTEFSPMRLFSHLSINEDQKVASPTTNLPNFVMDGVAPHLNFSPPKRKSQDWLTKMRIERQLRRDFEEPIPKIPKLEVTPKRCSSPKSDILRYFKVKCDGHSCSNKSSSSNVYMSSSHQQ